MFSRATVHTVILYTIILIYIDIVWYTNILRSIIIVYYLNSIRLTTNVVIRRYTGTRYTTVYVIHIVSHNIHRETAERADMGQQNSEQQQKSRDRNRASSIRRVAAALSDHSTGIKEKKETINNLRFDNNGMTIDETVDTISSAD